MLVVDASVLVPALADKGPDGDRHRLRLREEDLSAPELVDLEVAAVLRRLAQRGGLSEDQARRAVGRLSVMPIERMRHRPLLERVWELRANITAYDAAYVATAELRGATLLTADQRLARAPGARCSIEVLTPLTR